MLNEWVTQRCEQHPWDLPLTVCPPLIDTTVNVSTPCARSALFVSLCWQQVFQQRRTCSCDSWSINTALYEQTDLMPVYKQAHCATIAHKNVHLASSFRLLKLQKIHFLISFLYQGHTRNYKQHFVLNSVLCSVCEFSIYSDISHLIASNKFDWRAGGFKMKLVAVVNSCVAPFVFAQPPLSVCTQVNWLWAN